MNRKLFETIYNEANFGTEVGRSGRRAKGPYDNKLSPALASFDDQLDHERSNNEDELRKGRENKLWDAYDDAVSDRAWDKAHSLAVETDEAIADLVEELREHFPTVQVAHRIKSEHSAKRKASSKEVGWAGLDDMVGYALVFDTQEEVEGAADILKADDRVARIYDYVDSDPNKYYGYNCSLRADIGSEIQLETLRLLVFKDLYGHIFYEMLRDIGLKLESDHSDELEDLIADIMGMMRSAFEECRAAEGTWEKIKCPKAINNVDDDEKQLILANVRPETRQRAEDLLYDKIDAKEALKNCHELDGIDIHGLI